MHASLSTGSGQDPKARCGEGKWETCLVSVCLSFPICETHLVSSPFHKISPTSPIRTHANQILNVGSRYTSKMVLLEVVLASGSCIPIRKTLTGMYLAGEGTISW
jgi:hypothetical protein